MAYHGFLVEESSEKLISFVQSGPVSRHSPSYTVHELQHHLHHIITYKEQNSKGIRTCSWWTSQCTYSFIVRFIIAVKPLLRWCFFFPFKWKRAHSQHILCYFNVLHNFCGYVTSMIWEFITYHYLLRHCCMSSFKNVSNLLYIYLCFFIPFRSRVIHKKAGPFFPL